MEESEYTDYNKDDEEADTQTNTQLITATSGINQKGEYSDEDSFQRELMDNLFKRFLEAADKPEDTFTEGACQKSATWGFTITLDEEPSIIPEEKSTQLPSSYPYGCDDNLYFEKSESETDLSDIDLEETEITESSMSGLDTTVVPFSLMWTYGMNTRVPFMNLTEGGIHNVFFTASHEAVLYDYVKKEMILLQGHQNSITSASMDLKGKYLVTADSGPENSIIVWRMRKYKPVCTIFNANPGSGTAILTMSPNGKYIVSVTSDMPAIIKLWVWSSGSDQPVDTYLTDPAYGKPVGVVFNRTVQERFMVTFKRQIVFMKYHLVNKSFIEPRIPEIRNKNRWGKITDSCYLLECHECFASTTEGYVLVLGNTVYKKEFNIDDEYDARKIFITGVKVTVFRLNTISSSDGVVVTGDAKGNIRFYDRYVRLLYWCQSFQLPGVHKISFNRDPRNYYLASPIQRTPSATFEGKIMIDYSKDDNDVSEQYEILYKNMVPSDATIHRTPFIVRDFIVATADGNMVKIDYINNEAEELLLTTETPVAGIDVHSEMPYLAIAYRNGRVSLYNYLNHTMIHSSVLPPMIIDPIIPVEPIQTPTDASTSAVYVAPPPVDEKSSDYLMSKSVTCIKFSPKCYHLAVGRGNGEIFFLEPVLLHSKPGYPIRRGTHRIMKLIYSSCYKYFAYFDNNRTVFLFYYDIEKDIWLMVGKNRAHTKQITDLIFSTHTPTELYSIGLDKCLVKYDISNSINELGVVYRKRIDQSANPNCLVFCNTPDTTTQFLIADDEFKLKILYPDEKLYRHVFLGPAYGCYSEAPIKSMSMLPKYSGKYLIFATEKHIGIQKLPPDGNPYKYTGTVGHPYKIQQYMISSCGNYIFTAGRHDVCVLMWQINPEAVENMEIVGGKEINPYYCLIEGGSQGWLFKEMQNLFYYMQILHQGENTQLPRIVSENIALTELPDLMRACGFYPTEYEIETMLNDVKHRNTQRGLSLTEISFRDFVILYINHRPAHGISMKRLQKAFTQICSNNDDKENEIDSDIFEQVLCSKGESFAKDALQQCLSILMRFHQDEEQTEDSASYDLNLPSSINFDTLVYDILGIDMNRSQGSS
nr:cilia- and flagella-associated protein 251-like [Onthophagus taurus]